MVFKAKSEHVLASLSDDEIINHIKLAREAADAEQVKLAISLLAWRRHGNVYARVRVKIRNSVSDSEDVAMSVMEDAIKVKFRGEHMGEFVNLLNRITDRRIADFYKKKKLDTTPLPDEHEGDETVWVEVSGDEDMDGFVITRMVLYDHLEALSPRHRMVVELRISGYSSKDCVENVNVAFPDEDSPMGVANVDQIYKRFRTKIAADLKDGE